MYAFNDYFFRAAEADLTAYEGAGGAAGGAGAAPQAHTLNQTDWNCLVKVAQTEPGETPYKWESNIDEWETLGSNTPPDINSTTNTAPAPPPDVNYAMDHCNLIQQ